MHRFVARARGELTGHASWTGRVLTVHPRALNILRADGLAVSVVADRPSMSAMGVLATDLFGTPPDRGLVDVAVQMEDAVITIGNLASIDCADCPAWEGRVDTAAVRMMPDHLIQAVRESLFIHGTPDGLLGILGAGSDENAFVTGGRKSLEAGKPEELVGCGPGLTPAGDDFLTGAILASGALAGPDRARLERVLPGTTPPGRTLLWMALQGRFPAYLVDFIVITTGTEVSAEAIGNAVLAACAHGETSGTDAIAGFCWKRLHSAHTWK
jgi:hypothetical protein